MKIQAIIFKIIFFSAITVWVFAGFPYLPEVVKNFGGLNIPEAQAVRANK
jgi:hypothetical protein